MTIEEVVKIAQATKTNKFIMKHLDEDTIFMIVRIMESLDANDFKEINPDAEFEFNDIPIPYKKLSKQTETQLSFSKDLQDYLKEVLKDINKEGTNKEYPYMVRSDENSDEYSKLKSFIRGTSQTCKYDWAFIEEYIKGADKKINISLLHTHPNPLDEQHKTLYNKYAETLSKFGVEPNGLNISLADVYAEQYLEMLIAKYGKEITANSTILMHDGSLISFSTKSGLALTGEQKFEISKNKENNQDLTL